MTSSYQSSYSNQDVNVIAPAPRAQELLKSLFVQAGEPSCLPRGGSKTNSLQPGTTFSQPITISSSASPSPSLLQLPLQLSTSTLFSSDFPSASDRSNTSSGSQDDHHSDINTPSPHGGPVPGSWTVGPTASTEALERHMKASLPQVEDASKRLQQILGMRNEEAFKPPTLPMRPGQGTVAVGSAVDFNPALKHLRGSNAGLGIHIEQPGYGPRPGHGRTNWEVAEENQRLGGGEGTFQGQQRRVSEKPMTLRESLLMHGREPYGNQAKTGLRSLTFHDLTPDMRTGGFKNELLAHFEADPEGRTRLISYEVDIPVSERQQPNYYSKGVPFPVTERWIAFLISTPLLTFKPGTTSHPSIPVTLPPNLPQNAHPPTSWLIFAAPLRAIISHPPSKDNIISHTSSGTEILKPVNRYDYDFSRNGIPAFEFMDKSSVLGSALGSYLDHAIGGPFLRGQAIGAYESGEDFIHRPRMNGRGGSGEAVATEIDTGDEGELVKEDVRRWEDIENLEQEMGNSWWWNACQAKFLEDRNTWARIKDSMSRGCCRVVLRVEEGAQQYRGVVNGMIRMPRRVRVSNGVVPGVGFRGMESEYDGRGVVN